MIRPDLKAGDRIAIIGDKVPFRRGILESTDMSEGPDPHVQLIMDDQWNSWGRGCCCLAVKVIPESEAAPLEAYLGLMERGLDGLLPPAAKTVWDHLNEP